MSAEIDTRSVLQRLTSFEETLTARGKCIKQLVQRVKSRPIEQTVLPAGLHC